MKLRIGHLSTFYHTAFLLMGTDSLARAGIDVSWTLYATGPEMMGAMSRNEIDLAYIGLPPAMIGIDKGQRLKCIAGGHVEGTVLVAGRKYAPVTDTGDERRTLEQFSGRVIGCPAKGSIHDIILRDLIDRHRIQIEVKNYSWADFALAALTDGEIAAAAGTPALAVGAKRFAGGKVIIPPAMLWPYNPSYGIVATEDLLMSEETVLKFLHAHEAACNLIRTDPSEAARIVSKVTGIVDEDYVLDCYRISPKYCAALPPEYVASTMRFAGTLQRLGYVSKLLSADDVFDLRPIKKVHTGPQHYDNPGSL